jgi:hypothetical protein
MKRLVESWICAEKDHHGNTLAQAIRMMNEKHGAQLTPSRVSEWRRGVYVPTQLMLSHILHRTLPWALKHAGISASAEQFRALKECFWVHFEKDGKKKIGLL